MPEERTLTVTAIDDIQAEYCLNLPESVVRDLLDRNIPPFFIEIAPPPGVGSVKHHYLQSSKIHRLMLHGELS